MLSADQPELQKLIAGMFSSYGRREPDAAVLAAWWKALRPFYLSDVSRAVERAIAENKTLPTPAHILGLVRDKPAGEGRTEGGVPRCSADGCNADAHAGPLCTAHRYALHPELHPTYVLLARRMVEEGKREVVLRDPTMGQRYLDWIDRHSVEPRALIQPQGARAFSPSTTAPRSLAEALPAYPEPIPDDYALEEAWP